ncbi:MAG TPA: hydroxymethylbilane synthase [Deltaproteobacteria bacterium]|nr:hydroxymethylbilane synthase [Deltaproteobacteria bacterium]
MIRGGETIKTPLRIGTRGSKLALTQTQLIADRIKRKHPGLDIEIVQIRTKGDKLQDVALVTIGGKGVFVKEIEEALLRGDIHVAVHSMKDVPVGLPEDLEIGAVPQREDPRDVLVSRDGRKIEELRNGARIGTGSLRRTIQLRQLLPDAEVIPIRGNLDTRIRKIESEDLDGIVVAAAGMRRMGLTGQVSQYIPVEWMIPSAGQGILGVEVKRDDTDSKEIISFLNHSDTLVELTAERAFLKRLGGGCQVPIGAYCRKQGDRLILRGLLGTVDGSFIISEEVRGSCTESSEMGWMMAEKILARGGREILAEMYNGC